MCLKCWYRSYFKYAEANTMLWTGHGYSVVYDSIQIENTVSIQSTVFVVCEGKPALPQDIIC